MSVDTQTVIEPSAPPATEFQTDSAGAASAAAGSPKPDVVVIVGASSAIGRALAAEFAAAGHDLILAGRDVPDLQRSAADLGIRYQSAAAVVRFDAVAFDQLDAFWQQCEDMANGAVQGLVLLHGQLPSQPEAQKSVNLTRAAIDVNFTSAASLLTLAANSFEQRKRGFICVFSSVAGDRGRQSNYVYGSAKAALSTFTAGLRVRLFKSGVSVTCVKPGFVDTAMTWGLPGMFLVAAPQRVAADVRRAVSKGKAVVYTPCFWRLIMLIIRSVPDTVFKRMKM